MYTVGKSGGALVGAPALFNLPFARLLPSAPHPLPAKDGRSELLPEYPEGLLVWKLLDQPPFPVSPRAAFLTGFHCLVPTQFLLSGCPRRPAKRKAG